MLSRNISKGKGKTEEKDSQAFEEMKYLTFTLFNSIKTKQNLYYYNLKIYIFLVGNS